MAQQINLDALADAIAQRLSLVPKAELIPITFEKFAEVYLSVYAKPHKQSWLEDEERIARYLLPEFCEKEIHEITAADVMRLHSAMSRIPRTANLCLEQLSVMFKLAQTLKHYPKDIAIPTIGITRYPDNSRDRFLSPEELERLATVINKQRSPHLRVLLWLYLLTGLRKTELLSVKWEHIDGERMELCVPKTKNGTKHYLPLSPQALALFDSLPRRTEYVFPGKAGPHLTRFEGCWNRVRRQAGLEDIVLHDLRRTVGSWLAQSGVPILLVGAVLNHKCAKSTEVYARFARRDLRTALDQHGHVIGKYI